MLASCGGSQAPAVDTVYEEYHVEGTVDKTVAEMSVEGMMCEIGCGIDITAQAHNPQ